MSKSNEKKNQQLGMPYGTACNRLRKQVMFSMMQKCGMDTCHQCGEKIESVDKLSVEHKIPWLDSVDPVGLFFDIDNIAFSHLHCNCKASRGYTPPLIPCPSAAAYTRGCRCDGCCEAKRKRTRDSNRKVRAAHLANLSENHEKHQSSNHQMENRIH